jgi:hypothetical protein
MLRTYLEARGALGQHALPPIDFGNTPCRQRLHEMIGLGVNRGILPTEYQSAWSPAPGL